MRNRDDLFITEELLLLALRDEKGTVAPGLMINYALSGAALADLLLQNRIGVEEGRKNPRVRILSSDPLGDPVLDQCLERIAAAKRSAPLRTWVTRFAGRTGLQRRVAEGLCERRILRAEPKSVLLIFPRTVYPQADPKPKRELIERLRRAIAGVERDVDPKTVVLLSLAHSAKILPLVFDKRMLKERSQHIRSIINGELTGKATRQAIEAMQVAIFAATMIPAVTVSSRGNK